jgi:hypothetical protein
VAALVGWLRPPRDQTNSISLSIAMPPGDVLNIWPPVISPDGMSVWYSTSDSRVYVRRIDSVEARSLPGKSGTPGFWSSDSNAVFYRTLVDGQMLKARPGLGAQEVVLPGTGFADTRSMTTGAWSDSGILLLNDRDGKCFGVKPPMGGEPKEIGLPERFKYGPCMSPEFLPGGDDFLFQPNRNLQRRNRERQFHKGFCSQSLP